MVQFRWSSDPNMASIYNKYVESASKNVQLSNLSSGRR